MPVKMLPPCSGVQSRRILDVRRVAPALAALALLLAGCVGHVYVEREEDDAGCSCPTATSSAACGETVCEAGIGLAFECVEGAWRETGDPCL